jgi:hypothetical protein
MRLPEISSTFSCANQNPDIHNAQHTGHNNGQAIILPPVASQPIENQDENKSNKSFTCSLLGLNLIKEHKKDILNDLMHYTNDHDLIDCLKNHTISSSRRGEMVNWMIEVLTVFQCNESCFFKAVYIMDLYYSKTEK